MRFVLKSRIAIIISIYAISLPSCTGFKPKAEGVQNEIVVYVSEEDIEDIKPIVESIFSRIVYTPQPESIFKITYKSPDDLIAGKKRYNIVVASVLDKKDETGDKLVDKLLPSYQYEMVLDNHNQVFIKKDLFARGQVFLILAGNNKEELASTVEEKKDLIYDRFDQEFLMREKKYIYKRLEQKDLSKEFEEKYGWNMRIQHDYEIIKEEPKNNFVWLGRAYPYRWISVHWIDNGTEIELDKIFASKLNSQYPDKHYKSIHFTDQYLSVEETFFDQWPAWKISGLWEHNEKVMGGPFITYVFYDGVSDRIYLINILIHHPGSSKVVLLREMDIIAHTFKIQAS